MYGKRVANEEDILRHYDFIDIFDHYIEEFEDIDQVFCSELREDNDPSCAIQIYKGTPLYKDFGTGESFNAVSYVASLYNITYKDAINLIYNDMVLGDNILKSSISRKPKIDKGPKIIKVKPRSWNNNIDKEYWGSYYLSTSILKFFNVIPIEYFVLQDKVIDGDDPMYAFKFDRGVYKILRPYHKYKWTSNAGKEYYQGFDQLPWLGDTLIITSSMKDVMCLYLLGYNAIAPQSETQRLPVEFLRSLSKRFNRILLLFDNDDTGIKYSRIHYKEYGIPYTFIKGYKDPSELVMDQGPKKAKEIVTCTLQEII